jgi:hypothetical protein
MQKRSRGIVLLSAGIALAGCDGTPSQMHAPVAQGGDQFTTGRILSAAECVREHGFKFCTEAFQQGDLEQNRLGLATGQFSSVNTCETVHGVGNCKLQLIGSDFAVVPNPPTEKPPVAVATAPAAEQPRTSSGGGGSTFIWLWMHSGGGYSSMPVSSTANGGYVTRSGQALAYAGNNSWRAPAAAMARSATATSGYAMRQPPARVNTPSAQRAPTTVARSGFGTTASGVSAGG